MRPGTGLGHQLPALKPSGTGVLIAVNIRLHLPALFLWLKAYTLLGTVPLQTSRPQSQVALCTYRSIADVWLKGKGYPATPPRCAPHSKVRHRPRSQPPVGLATPPVAPPSALNQVSRLLYDARRSPVSPRAREHICTILSERTPNSAWTAPPRGHEAASRRPLVGSAGAHRVVSSSCQRTRSRSAGRL